MQEVIKFNFTDDFGRVLKRGMTHNLRTTYINFSKLHILEIEPVEVIIGEDYLHLKKDEKVSACIIRWIGGSTTNIIGDPDKYTEC